MQIFNIPVNDLIFNYESYLLWPQTASAIVLKSTTEIGLILLYQFIVLLKEILLLGS